MRFVLAAASSFLAATPLPAAPTELVLDPASGYIVPVEVNGVSLRLRVDPGAHGAVLLNPEAAERARLRPSLIPMVGLVGSVRVRGRFTRTDAVIAGQPRRRTHFNWFEGHALDGVDGEISPALLPYDRVVFRLGSDAAGHARSTVPVRMAVDYGLRHHLTFGEHDLPVRFSIFEPVSSATAAAGAVMTQYRQGAWDGSAYRHPVRFSVERPVRPMRLGQPLAFDKIALTTFVVRTADHRGIEGLPVDPAEADEIIVSGRAGRQRPFLGLALGRDRLAGCSAITYEKNTSVLLFDCPA